MPAAIWQKATTAGEVPKADGTPLLDLLSGFQLSLAQPSVPQGNPKTGLNPGIITVPAATFDPINMPVSNSENTFVYEDFRPSWGTLPLD